MIKLHFIVGHLASSPTTSTLSYSSANTSKSTDTLRTMTGMSHDDVFVPNSISSMTPNTNRQSLHYLPQITQALPDEQPEYLQRLASAIKDAKEQYVTDFLRYTIFFFVLFIVRYSLFGFL
jgi:hypothetical protein